MVIVNSQPLTILYCFKKDTLTVYGDLLTVNHLQYYTVSRKILVTVYGHLLTVNHLQYYTVSRKILVTVYGHLLSVNHLQYYTVSRKILVTVYGDLLTQTLFLVPSILCSQFLHITISSQCINSCML